MNHRVKHIKEFATLITSGLNGRSFYKFVIACLFFLITGRIFSVQAQVIPIDDIKEEQFRIQQLFHGSELSSFTNRPVWDKIYQDYMELGTQDYGMWSQPFTPFQYEYKSYFKVGIYEPKLQFTTNSSVPA